MRIRTFWLTVLVAAQAAVAASEETPRTDINPALQYYRSFLLAPDLAKADSDYLFNNSWHGLKLPDRVGKLLAGYDNQFKLVRAGARATVPCDWGVDMSAGPGTLLPQLARAKAIAQVTRLRVMWDLQNGRQDEARDDLLAAFALARNVATDGTLISILVQIASEAIDSSTIAANFGQFSPEVLRQLADGMAAGPPRRTVAESIRTEKTLFLDWSRRKIEELQEQNPGNDAKVMQGIHQLLGFEEASEGRENLWERITQAAGGTSEGVLKLMKEREQTYDKVVAFVSLPYAEFQKKEKEFRDEFENSPNPFIAVATPPFLKAREREFRILATLGLVRAALEYKLQGEAGLNSVLDPCGSGPFRFRRFAFEGVDRGFELKSAFDLGGNQAVLVFVETQGPPFQVDGNFPGRPLPKTVPQE